ncbi:MAG TPA: hypothetical protein VF002_10300, partial [Gaiellaceae bacterium]
TTLLPPIAISVAAALVAQLEGIALTRWAASQGTGCRAAVGQACSLGAGVGPIVGAFFAVETLAATLVALVLLRNGKRAGAVVSLGALLAALAVEHVWLLT